MSYFLSALSGFLLMLCFPPFDLGFMACIALVPLFIAIDRQKSKEGFTLSFFCGLVFFSVSAFWVSVFHPLALPLGIIYLSLFFGLFGFVICFKNGFSSPFLQSIFLASAWTGIEYIKTLGFLGFPWFSLGYTQHKFLELIQISRYTGVWGVTFLIVFFNAGFSQALLKKRLDKILVLTTVIIGCIYLWGHSVIKKYSQNFSGDELNVAVVQGNFDVYTYFPADAVLSRLSPLSMQAVKQNKIDLVVWTETVLLENLQKDEILKQRLIQLVKDMNCYLLLGTPSFRTVGNERKHFNSAVLISPDGGISYYNKNHLVPFGELVPGNKRFGFMGKFAQLVQSGEYDPDSEAQVLDTGKGKFGTMICFEGIFGDYAGKFVNKGANFLVNITEDDWMKKYPSGMKQHAYMSVFRAVENQIYYVRAANSGLSFILDPAGRIIDTMPMKKEGFFVGKIHLKNDAKTFYTKYGDMFVRVVIFCSIVMTFILFGKKSRD
ncbi:MAG: apolipoprotein N-acyltransferase [bacterium]|nr:apolipoprotein N-acyltransferase [bacterium]